MSYLTGPPLTEPSWRGHLDSRMDALHLIHAARLGYITLIPRRPSSSEMRRIVDAGAIFVFEVKGSFNNWNDYSTQWTHLHNGMRRGGYTNSVSATAVPEFRKKITRFQIGTIKYQVVCYHDDNSRENSNLARFPKPVLANTIPPDQNNTSTTLNFRLRGCNERGCEIYEWVKTSDQASETDELLEDEAHARQHSRAPLPVPPSTTSTSEHDELVSALYPEENLTYKYKYRYKTTIRNSQMQAAQDSQYRYEMLSQASTGSHPTQVSDAHNGAPHSPGAYASRSPTTPQQNHDYAHPRTSPVSPVSPQRNYYAHLPSPGSRYGDNLDNRQYGTGRTASPSTNGRPSRTSARADPYDREMADHSSRHERTSSSSSAPSYSSGTTPLYAVHGRAFSHSGLDAYGRPLVPAQASYSAPGPPPPPPAANGYSDVSNYHSRPEHASSDYGSSGQYGNTPQAWRIIAPAPSAYSGEGPIPSARELIDGAMRKEFEREQRRDY